MTAPRKKKLISLDESTIAGLKKLAFEKDVSVKKYIEYVLTDHVINNIKKD